MPRHGGRKVPTSDELLEIVHDRGGHVSARDLARELGLRGGDKAELKRRLRSLHGGGKRQPSMSLCEIVELDEDGELWAESQAMPGAAILIAPGNNGSLTEGDRLLARLERMDDGTILGLVFKILPKTRRDIVGVVQKAGNVWWLAPTRKDAKRELRLESVPDEVQSGDLVRAELAAGRPLAPPAARIVERFGRFDEPAAVSMAVAIELELPTVFLPEVIAEAERALPAEPGNRADLRELPLVTIDGEDARDFDDAVFVEPDPSPKNPGGFHAIVAIADVAHYVGPGSKMDQEAYKRGNSVYFPDRVLPMLPEALSNGLCSLRPREDRACISCHMTFDAKGKLTNWTFRRSIMRSLARLTYEQVQAAREGRPDDQTRPLLETVIQPLYALFERLLEARRKRGTIELEIPERRVTFNANGGIESISPRQRLDSHMLIEELMIAANVAAAHALERKRVPCIYRIHDRPDAIKLEALQQYLTELGLSSSRNDKSQHDFNRLLGSVDDERLREQMAQLVLRAQSQAIYSTNNVGHFGLNLHAYAHFTSPIRRYSDLILHRLLIAHLNLDGRESGMSFDEDILAHICENVSSCERKAIDAERKALAKYVALFMADRVGAVFEARIASIQRFGFFVNLDDTGAEGLVPVSSLGEEFFIFDEARQVLVGERSRTAFGLGDSLSVRLEEADTIKGLLLFAVDQHKPSKSTKEAASQNLKKGSRNRNFRRRGRGR